MPLKRRGQSVWGTTDCETDPFLTGRVPEPFLWGVYLGGEYHQFDSTAEYIDYVSELDGFTLYGHNAGKFDYHYIRDHIREDEKITVINGRLAKFHIGKCEFRDSLNLIPAPLSRFDKTKIDYKKFERDVRHLHMEEISSYLLDDCRVLYDILEAYFAEYGQSLTQAGAAMRLWRTKFGGENFVQQTAAQATAMRPFYFGGRVECFISGHHRKRFVGIDMRSAYPKVMTDKHPLSPSGLAMDCMPSDSQLPASFVNLTCVSDGALPFREPDGSLSFPNDGQAREYHVTGHEIAAAMDYNAIRDIEVHVAFVFSMLMSFSDYVDYFFEMRKKYQASGNAALDYFCKIFLNALYGKFGADPDNYDEMLISSEENLEFWTQHGYVGADGNNWGKGRYLMARQLPEELRHYYNVATASSITGQQRANMFRALRSVGTPYYCDTDGIFARDLGTLQLGKELGQWKLEIEGERFAIAGKKTYAMHANAPSDSFHSFDSDVPDHSIGKPPGRWKVACKGAKLSPRRIIDIAEGREVEYAPAVPTYSIHRAKPVFINRKISRTTKSHLV